jgi:mono/diheme cytochrome c family protein
MNARFLGLFACVCLAGTAAENGRALYKNYCVGCHWKDGSPAHGGADLRQPLKYGSDLNSVLRVIKNGVAGTQMPGFSDLSEVQLRALARHVVYLNQKAQSNRK